MIVIKIIIKTIVNCIKQILIEMVGLNQSNFVHTKYSTDNIIVAHEIIHTMKRKIRMKKMIDC